MKKIFLISGFAQHGKDSTGNILKKLLPGNLLIIHNADLLKFYAKQYMGWNGEKDEKGRTLLQWLGTEKVRYQYDPLFWIKRTCDIIKIYENDYDYFAVCDTRYKNEIYYPMAIFPNRVITIRVSRLFFDNGLTEEQKKHPSETELIGFQHDYCITSKSGLDKLQKEIENIIEFLE